MNLIFFASVFYVVKFDFNLIIYNTKKSTIIYSILIQIRFTLWLTINCFADIDSLNEIFQKLYFWFSSLPIVITWQKKNNKKIFFIDRNLRILFELNVLLNNFSLIFQYQFLSHHNLE